MENPQIQRHIDSEITIDISKIFKVIGKHKWTILIVTILFSGIGIFIAINTPNEYVSQVQILPELESKDVAGGLSKFKSLAGLAGVDLSSLSSSEAVRPDLYPNILQSTPFLMDVMNLKIYTYKYKRTLAISRFLAENGKQDLMTKIFGESKEKIDEDVIVINPKDIPLETIRLDKKQDELIKDLQKRIGATLDKKSGVINISVKMERQWHKDLPLRITCL